MANQKQLEILLSGVDKWNEWRDRNEKLEIDLSNADLRELDLKEVDLGHANLCKANLSDANIEKAFFSYADLSGANLADAFGLDSNFIGAKMERSVLTDAEFSDALFWEVDLRHSMLQNVTFHNADLSRANLTGSNLFGANLHEANLRNAVLKNANFSSANLRNANLINSDLSGSNFNEVFLLDTVFGQMNLSNIIGLDNCEFGGPSIIDEFTLLNSPSLPINFLRGIGLSEAYIEYLPSIRSETSAFNYYSCFISYSHTDKPFAQRLHKDLQAAGIRVWLDEHQILPGQKIHTEVDQAIRIWDKVLLICSETALKNSWWVNNEIETAFEKEARIRKERGEEVLALIPLNLDGFLFQWVDGKATQIKKRLAADFTNWKDPLEYQKQFDKLVRALKADNSGKPQLPIPKL